MILNKKFRFTKPKLFKHILYKMSILSIKKIAYFAMAAHLGRRRERKVAFGRKKTEKREKRVDKFEKPMYNHYHKIKIIFERETRESF